jgi:hypothetical protein
MRPNILDPKFKYTPAAYTNIQDKWREHGWRPKNEMPVLQRVDDGNINQADRRVRPAISRVR